MANLSSKLRSAQDDAAPWLRILWAAATGLLTIAVLAVGGIYALQYATVIFGLPFAFVVVLVMFGLMKALRIEGRRTASGAHALPLMLSARANSADKDKAVSWQSRLARAMNFVDIASATEYQERVIRPALSDLATELSAGQVAAEVVSGVVNAGTTSNYPTLSYGRFPMKIHLSTGYR